MCGGKKAFSTRLNTILKEKISIEQTINFGYERKTFEK